MTDSAEQVAREIVENIDADWTWDWRRTGAPARRDAVEAIATALRSSGWRTDVENAPRDGTAILIARPTEFQDEEGWHVVRWDDDWWQVHDGKFDHPLRGDEPTHWQPLTPPVLPQPPASTEG